MTWPSWRRPRWCATQPGCPSARHAPSLQAGLEELPLTPSLHLPLLGGAASVASLAHATLESPGRAPVQVWLAHARLPRVATDLLVTLHASAPADHTPTLMAILASLRVVDWGLFG